jgi:hypothetical protein
VVVVVDEVAAVAHEMSDHRTHQQELSQHTVLDSLRKAPSLPKKD